MKALDDYLRENLEQFNTEEPLPGHHERFDARLAQLDKKRGNNIRIIIFKVAASVLLGMVITYGAIREIRYLNRDALEIVSASSYPELNEAEQFYTSQLSLYDSKIKDLRFNNDPNEKKQVIRELNEMDKQVQVMKKDLWQNPDDERIVHAIINFYQVKIELMDMIITRTQQTSNSIL